MNRLQQAWVWLRRIGHCRGFGIQSPTDYRFVRYVVNESWPYYAYAELGTADDWLRSKLGRLYFRLANFLQPDAVVDLLGYEEYQHAGCRKAVVSNSPSEHASLALVPTSISREELAAICGNNMKVVVVEGTGKLLKTQMEILKSMKATVVFDLYYCAVAFFDPQRSVQTYIVNF